MNDTCIVHPPQYDYYEWDLEIGFSYADPEILVHEKLNPKCKCKPKIEIHTRKSGPKAGQVGAVVIHRHISE